MGFRKRRRHSRLLSLEKGQCPNSGAYQRCSTVRCRQRPFGPDILGFLRRLQRFHWSCHDLPGCVIRVPYSVLCPAEKGVGQGRAIFIGQVRHGDCE